MRLQLLRWFILQVVITVTLSTYVNTQEPSEPAWVVQVERRHWHSAALACRRNVAGGGRLAVPRSREEALAMGALLADAFPHPSDAPWAFVGLTDLAEEGEFATEDGVYAWEVGYERWHAWNAHSVVDDHCVALDRFGLFWDVPCAWRLPFFCARPPPPPPPTPTCPSLSQDISQQEDLGEPNANSVGAYDLELSALNWWAAGAACARSGRRLALPRSRFEAAALRDLLTEAEAESHAPPDAPSLLAFVGASDLAHAGRMRTVLGDPFDQLESERWRYSTELIETQNNVSHPEESTSFTVGADDDSPEAAGGVSCAAVNRQGRYELALCSMPLPFFCERPPPPQEPVACPTTPPPPPDPDTLPPPDGHFQLHHLSEGGATWDRAAKGCLDDGGVLAVPETSGEARALADLLREVPHPSDNDIGADIWAFVGIRDFQGDGNFSTIFGSDASSALGASWGPGQPNGEGTQPCVVLDRAASLWDVPCTWQMGFFCRRFPAEPPWTAPGARAVPGRRGDKGWKVDSEVMRRWLREMRRLGAGSALDAEEDGTGTEEGIAAGPEAETARGFAYVDLDAWIESFREGALSDYAPFDFHRATPSTRRL